MRMPSLRVKGNEDVIEYGVAYPNIEGGPIDSIIGPMFFEDAERMVKAWTESGIDSYVVKRLIAKWAPFEDDDDAGFYERMYGR